ncbi:polymorphic toxin type 15 domain-containing protein [Streptococcus loxodontisalivarius]
MDDDLQKQIAQAKKAEQEAKKKAEEKEEADWKKHHPWEAYIRECTDWWSDLWKDNAEGTDPVTQLIYGALGGVTNTVGGLLEGGVSLVHLGIEQNKQLLGIASDWERADVQGTIDSVVVLGRMAIGGLTYLSPVPQIALDVMPKGTPADELISDQQLFKDTLSGIGKQVWTDISEGDWYAMGGYAFEVGSLFVGGGLGKLGKTGELAEAADSISDVTRAVTKMDDLSDLSKLRYLDEAVGFSDELMDANSLRKYAEGLEAAAQSAKVKMAEVLDDLTISLKTTYGYAQETVDNVVDTIRSIELPTISPQYAYVAEGSVGEVTTIGDVIASLRTPSRQTVLSDGNDLASVSSKLDEVVSNHQLYQSSDEVARLEKIEVEFNHNPKHDEIEFSRQLANQEKGMNELTVQEYLDNREKYIAEGRAIEGNAAQQAARKEALSRKFQELVESGMSRGDATTEAQKWLDTQAALHNPDQIAGGNPFKIGGMGDRAINSSIGSQWKYRIDVVDEQIQVMASKMTPEQLRNTYLNVKLTY